VKVPKAIRYVMRNRKVSKAQSIRTFHAMRAG
jgi:hypothetical protein